MLREGNVFELLLPGDRIVSGWLLHTSGGINSGVGFVVLLPDGRVLGPYYVRESGGLTSICRVVAYRDVKEAIPVVAFQESPRGVYVGGEFYGKNEPWGPRYAGTELSRPLGEVVAEISNAFDTMWGRSGGEVMSVSEATHWLEMVRRLRGFVVEGRQLQFAR
ncbi:MAG: hypothetical protein R3C18_11590 [Planctomycetaceae bacterium]